MAVDVAEARLMRQKRKYISTIDSHKRTVRLGYWLIDQVQNEAGEWIDAKENQHTCMRPVDNSMLIDPATRLITTDETVGVPAFNWIVTRTLAEMGATSLDDNAFEVIAVFTEEIAERNNMANLV